MAVLPQPRLSDSDKNDVRICESGPGACDRVEGFATVTLRAGARLHPHASLTRALENVFDPAYKTFASGAYSPGRNVVLFIRGTL